MAVQLYKYTKNIELCILQTRELHVNKARGEREAPSQ